jgi:hypothetical protein
MCFVWGRNIETLPRAHTCLVPPLPLHISTRQALFAVTNLGGGGSMLVRNAGIYLQVHTALLPRRKTSTVCIVLSNNKCAEILSETTLNNG